MVVMSAKSDNTTGRQVLSLTRGFGIMRDSRRLVNEESSEEKAGGRWLHQRVYREVARGFVQCLFGVVHCNSTPQHLVFGSTNTPVSSFDLQQYLRPPLPPTVSTLARASVAYALPQNDHT